MGGVQNTRGNSGVVGGGGLFLWSKNGNSGVEGGSYEKIPSMVGYGYFLEPHNIHEPWIINQLDWKLADAMAATEWKFVTSYNCF